MHYGSGMNWDDGSWWMVAAMTGATTRRCGRSEVLKCSPRVNATDNRPRNFCSQGVEPGPVPGVEALVVVVSRNDWRSGGISVGFLRNSESIVLN